MTVLRRMAASLTAADLQQPFGPSLTFDETALAAEQRIAAAEPRALPHERRADAPLESVSLVGPTEDRLTHFLWAWDLHECEPGARIDSVAKVIPIERVVAGDTPAIVVASLANLNEPDALLFVLTGNRLTGYVARSSFRRIPAFTAAVLALLLDVEQACADACRWEPDDAAAAFERLSPGRKTKALELYRMKGSHPTSPEGLLDYTTFADKGTMIAESPLLQGISKSALARQFRLMEKVRNGLAHGKPPDLDELLRASSVAEELLRRLRPPEKAGLRLAVSNVDLCGGRSGKR